MWHLVWCWVFERRENRVRIGGRRLWGSLKGDGEMDAVRIEVVGKVKGFMDTAASPENVLSVIDSRNSGNSPYPSKTSFPHAMSSTRLYEHSTHTSPISHQSKLSHQSVDPAFLYSPLPLHIRGETRLSAGRAIFPKRSITYSEFTTARFRQRVDAPTFYSARHRVLRPYGRCSHWCSPRYVKKR